MNLKLPVTEDQVEGLVRGYLDEEARRVDVARLSQRVAERSATLLERSRRTRALWSRAGRWTAAACLAFAVAGGMYLAVLPEQAGAYALVEAAQQALASGPDRCYRVEGQLPPAWVKAYPFLRVGPHAQFWTRGDQFRVSTGEDDQQIAWGQDREGNFWIVLGDEGFVFRPQEAPRFLNRAKPFLALRMSPVVQRFLKDYELTRERAGKLEGRRVVRVHAALKPDRTALFNTADLEIEPETKLLRQLQLERTVQSGVVHQVSFTLVDQQDLGDDLYRIESSLPPGGEVYGPDRPEERERRFSELLSNRRDADRAASRGRQRTRRQPVQNEQPQADAVDDE